MIDEAFRAEAKASDDSSWGHRQEHMKAFLPAFPIAEAQIRLACKPSQRSRRLALRVRAAVLLRTRVVAVLRGQNCHQMQAKGGDGITLQSHLTIEPSRDQAASERRRADAASPSDKKPVHAGSFTRLSHRCQRHEFGFRQRRGSPPDSLACSGLRAKSSAMTYNAVMSVSTSTMMSSFS
jgi:hypothetical protein